MEKLAVSKPIGFIAKQEIKKMRNWAKTNGRNVSSSGEKKGKAASKSRSSMNMRSTGISSEDVEL